MSDHTRPNGAVWGIAVALGLLALFALWIELHHWLFTAGHKSIWWNIRPWERAFVTPRIVSYTLALIASTGWGSVAALRRRNSLLIEYLDLGTVIQRTALTTVIALTVLTLLYISQESINWEYAASRPGAILWIPLPVAWLTLIISSCVAISSVMGQKAGPATNAGRFDEKCLAWLIAVVCTSFAFWVAATSKPDRLY